MPCNQTYYLNIDDMIMLLRQHGLKCIQQIDMLMTSTKYFFNSIYSLSSTSFFLFFALFSSLQLLQTWVFFFFFFFCPCPCPSVLFSVLLSSAHQYSITFILPKHILKFHFVSTPYLQRLTRIKSFQPECHLLNKDSFLLGKF